ncbi:MAG: hypothetical protein H3C36_02325 [Chitinophagaceae bacterium]|nr:hypothetical protein [Chitinophagaceae bacterium]
MSELSKSIEIELWNLGRRYGVRPHCVVLNPADVELLRNEFMMLAGRRVPKEFGMYGCSILSSPDVKPGNFELCIPKKWN